MFREEFVGLKKSFALHEFLGYLVEQAKVGLFSSKEVDKNQQGGIVYDANRGTEDPVEHCVRYPVVLKEREMIDYAFKRNEFSVFVNIYKNDTAVILLEVYNPDSIHHPLLFSISNVDGWQLEC